MYPAPFSIAHSAKSVIGRLLDEGYDFDVIDAHYFYPDGVAAALLGKYFNKAVVISALGSDINLILKDPIARRMILWAGKQAAAMITVCQSLKTKMVKYGMDGDRITPLRNGVDLELFRPVEREASRQPPGMDGLSLLSVGHLVENKGHHHVISALAELPGVSLMIAGSGPERKKLEALTRTTGVAERVTFLGAVPQEALREYYGAADALVLASSREGWANVLLEAMACGTPVLASDVGGTAEVLRSPAAGVLMSSATPDNIVEGIRRLQAQYPDRAATRAYAEGYSWRETTQGQIHVFRQAALQYLPDTADTVPLR
jgi:teichuronic acid biosynthesis glycosyltransferase TuaC